MPKYEEPPNEIAFGRQLLSQDRVHSGLAARIAWKLLWYGNWSETEQVSRVEDGALFWVDHVYSPARPVDHEIAPTDSHPRGAALARDGCG